MIFCVLLPLLLPLAAAGQQRSQVWCPDNGDGTFRNPVLNADYSDPDAIAVGEDFYLTASSFNCVPGLPVLHSRDLVNWEIVGHGLGELTPKEVFDTPQHGKGVWAPAIRFHGGEFLIYWGDPDRGIFVVKASDPRGAWSAPVCVVEGKGMIDPCPLWDDDGRCYLVNAWAGSRAGFNSVLTVRELSPDGMRAAGAPRIVFDGGQENHTTEGPKFYRKDGFYWIFCPAGGVQKGWQLALRSRSVFGPYEARRVMAQGSTSVNGPHQGAWVHTASGEDWFLHFNDRGPYGRVVFLQPMRWLEDGWPVIGRAEKGETCGEPYLSFRKPASSSRKVVNPQESDEFDDGKIGPQWQWQANYSQLWGMPTSGGCIRLYSSDLQPGFRSLWETGSLFLQKLPADSFSATAKLRFSSKEDGQWGGVVMMGMNYAALALRRDGDGFLLQRLDCKGADTGGEQTSRTLASLKPSARDTIPYSPAIHLDIWLRMDVSGGVCRFFYSTDGRKFRPAGEEFPLRQGKWIGAKMGLFCVRDPESRENRGWIDVDWFRVGRLNLDRRATKP